MRTDTLGGTAFSSTLYHLLGVQDMILATLVMTSMGRVPTWVQGIVKTVVNGRMHKSSSSGATITMPIVSAAKLAD